MSAGYEIHTTQALMDLANHYAAEVRELRGPSRLRSRQQLSAIEKVLRERGAL